MQNRNVDKHFWKPQESKLKSLQNNFEGIEYSFLMLNMLARFCPNSYIFDFLRDVVNLKFIYYFDSEKCMKYMPQIYEG